MKKKSPDQKSFDGLCPSIVKKKLPLSDFPATPAPHLVFSFFKRITGDEINVRRYSYIFNVLYHH